MNKTLVDLKIHSVTYSKLSPLFLLSENLTFCLNIVFNFNITLLFSRAKIICLFKCPYTIIAFTPADIKLFSELQLSVINILSH